MRFKLITTLITGILLVSACAGNVPESTPTVDPNAVQTQAIQTFGAGLTQTALVAPTETPSPTLTPAATATALNTPIGITPLVQSTTVPATTSCYSMSFVSDVTIPDNTPVTPGQTFTKTWKVTNNGSCPWDAGFKFAFTGGDAMSGTTYTLPSKVEVNATTNISVAMTAPNKTGTVRGNWRMSTAAGQFFGDEVYVVVVVGGSAATSTTYP